MRKEQRGLSYAEVLTQVRRLAKKDADRIRTILEDDPDWTLEDGKRERRALTRLSKKAVGLLFPEYKALSCYGSGTAHYWVHVNIMVPGEPSRKQIGDIKQRAKMMLEQVGLKYGIYLPDSLPGKDEFTPCLSVQVNDINWGHY